MSEKFSRKISYNTWDEAFRGLAPKVRQESVRVAEYAQVLYLQAVKSDFYSENEQWQNRMQSQYGELAFKCGLYHQFGKAFMPTELQLWSNNKTEEQQSAYKQYTVDGPVLVEHLHRKTARVRTWGRQQPIEDKIENIPTLMIMESCAMHMERFDGTGYPEGLSLYDVSPIGYIVGLAKEFDRLVCSTKSETPFEDTFETLTGTLNQFPPELIDCLKKVKSQYEEIYKKYIQYSRTLPATIPLVDKREDRPMGLTLTPMLSTKTQKPVYYMADIWFGTEIMKVQEDLPSNNLASVFKRTGIYPQLCTYFMYEACDTVLRMENCQLSTEGVILNILPEFYSLTNQMELFDKLFADQPIDKKHFMLTVPENAVINATKSTLENIRRYMRHGVNIVLKDYNPERFSVEKLTEIGFKYVIPSKDLYGTEYLARTIPMLERHNIKLMAAGVDEADKVEWLKEHNFICYGGPAAGVAVTEDSLIRECLLSED